MIKEARFVNQMNNLEKQIALNYLERFYFSKDVYLSYKDATDAYKSGSSPSASSDETATGRDFSNLIIHNITVAYLVINDNIFTDVDGDALVSQFTDGICPDLYECVQFLSLKFYTIKGA